jgi:TldD protein
LVRKRALTELVGTALFATDRRIADVCVRYRDTVDDIWVVTSEGADLHETQSDITIEVLVQAEEAGTTEHALASLSVRGDWAAVERWAAAVGEVAERAVRLLHAVPVRSGRVPVILGPRAAGVLVHRVAGHLCLGDGEAEDTPSLEIGTRLGPEALVIGDDGTAPDLRGTRAFDDEGTPPLNTVLVRSGVLIGRIHTRASAALAGATPTGNARAGGLRAPSARLSNTYLAGGRGSLDDLLRDVPAGVYIEDLEHLSLRAGRAVIRAGFARVIRRGGLAEVVKNLAVAGEVLALFGQIDRVAGDFSWDPGASRCDGGVGGALPVSTGAPHVRLVDVMVGAAA